MAAAPHAADVVAALEAVRDPGELPKVRSRLADDEPAIGVRMGHLFDVAKQHRDLDLGDVHDLLDHPAYEPRMAAWCILDFKARARLDEPQRSELAGIYLDRHDRITTWDMVDRAAPRVLGEHLIGKDLGPLHELAGADDPLRRRSALTAPLQFVKAGSEPDLVGALAVAAKLVADRDPIVSKPIGILLKHAGAGHPELVESFLEQHAADLARPVLRDATAKLPEPARRRWT